MFSTRKVWVYARVKERNAEQLVRQMYDLLRYASEHGYHLAGNSQEVTPAQNIDRSALVEILDALRAGEANTILVQNLSRLTENTDELFTLMRTLQDYRAAVATSETDLREELSVAGIGNQLLSRGARNGLPTPWL